MFNQSDPWHIFVCDIQSSSLVTNKWLLILIVTFKSKCMVRNVLARRVVITKWIEGAMSTSYQNRLRKWAAPLTFESFHFQTHLSCLCLLCAWTLDVRQVKKRLRAEQVQRDLEEIKGRDWWARERVRRWHSMGKCYDGEVLRWTRTLV